MTQKLKYQGYSIVMQEVPNEISLSIDVSGCPYKCKGCHSKYLWEYDGNYLLNDFYPLFEKYKDYVSCVCFMGGDWNKEELITMLKIVKKNGLKTCLYTGNNNLEDMKKFYKYLDYLKIGSFIEEYGGLRDKKTNQRFYKVNDGLLEDITPVFWNKI